MRERFVYGNSMRISILRSCRSATLGLLLGAALNVGCAVNSSDLTRWEKTQRGPRRLSAVVVFDKYPHDLRVEAVMSLIRMRPRKGKHVGIERLVHGTLDCDQTYVEEDRQSEPCVIHPLAPETRARVLADVIPRIIEELRKPPPAPTQGDKAVVDESFRYKDAAFLLLTYDKTQLISDAGLRKQLEAALVDWAIADFERRLSDRNQAFGMEQLLRHIGPSAVVGVPNLMGRKARNLGKMATLVAKIGDQATKEHAGAKLVEVAKYIASDQWREEKLPDLKNANRRGGYDPGEKELKTQLDNYQNETLIRVFGSMKKVGGPAVVEFGLKVAEDKKQSKKRRQAALAALEGHIDKKNTKVLDRLLAIAKSNAPGEVKDQAFRRIKELPRDATAAKLYAFFELEDWKVRRLAGATLLSISEAKHIDEFLDNLDKLATNNFNMPEAFTYGAYLGALKPEADAHKKLQKRMARGGAQSRLAALAYLFDRGTKQQLGLIEPYYSDKQKTPECKEDAGCTWACFVTEGKKKVSKEIKTVGDFARYCIKPKLEQADKDAKKKPSNNNPKTQPQTNQPKKGEPTQ